MNVPDLSRLRSDIATLHAAALAAAEPSAAVRRVLAVRRNGLEIGGHEVRLAAGARLHLVAAGKAASPMARGALACLGPLVTAGVVVTPVPRAGEAAEFEWPTQIRRMVGAHPLPDASSLAAGNAVRALVTGMRDEDLVLVLLSGGASSLVEILQPAVTLDQLRRTTDALQRAGADVHQLNTVRRALSLLKGGGLARLAAPARVVTLAISDVVGDRPEAIASGPTVPSPTTPRDALRVLRDTGTLTAVPELTAILAGLVAADVGEGPRPGSYRVIASNCDAAAAVRAAAEQMGFRAGIVTVCLQGEAREAGRLVGGSAVSMRTHGVPFAPPGCLVFGGETTVTVRGNGRGGRNMELALGAAIALDGVSGTAVFSFATDGVDGSGAAAGALATSDTLKRAAALGHSAASALAENDSAPFFDALGDLWRSGPTGTNVNDLAIALAYPVGEEGR